MDVPVVANCGDYEGLDGSDAEQCEAESEARRALIAEH